MENSSVWRSILAFFVLVLFIGVLGSFFFAAH
jgi:sensor histidine kinase regulating citrate/malate metabolism